MSINSKKLDKVREIVKEHARVINGPIAAETIGKLAGVLEIDLGEYQFNLVVHLYRQREWSQKTFGPGHRTRGVIDHIRKELCEIEAEPLDITEWVDVILLAFDGAWRAGHTPESIAKAIAAKQARNETRDWPDWRTQDPNKAIEHMKSGDSRVSLAEHVAQRAWQLRQTAVVDDDFPEKMFLLDRALAEWKKDHD